MFEALSIDGRSRHSASDQIYLYVIDEIIGLNIHSQTMFPITSDVALQFDIPTSTVQEAYSRLVQEKYCEVFGETITLIDEELRRSIHIRSMEDVVVMATTMNMLSSTETYDPVVTTLPAELLLLSKQTMPKESLVLSALNLGDGIPLSYVVVVVNTEKLSPDQSTMATDISFYQTLSNHLDSVVQPTILSACRLSEEVSSLMRLPTNIPSVCMHSSIDFLAHRDVAQMYVMLTPRVFLTLKA